MIPSDNALEESFLVTVLISYPLRCSEPCWSILNLTWLTFPFHPSDQNHLMFFSPLKYRFDDLSFKLIERFAVRSHALYCWNDVVVLCVNNCHNHGEDRTRILLFQHLLVSSRCVPGHETLSIVLEEILFLGKQGPTPFTVPACQCLRRRYR